MRALLELGTGFDWTLFPRTIGSGFLHADWRGAWQRGGVAGVAGEALASLAGTNTYPFFVPNTVRETMIRNLLASKGIKMWGIGFAFGEMYFRVNKKQAGFAQYLMQRAGVPLSHRMYAGPVEQPETRQTTTIKDRARKELKRLW